MYIHLLRADIESLKVDAMVAPADGQSHETSGRAVVVTGGNLLARFIIHVTVPDVTEPDAEGRLHAATLTALERAEELAVASVGFPPIGIAFGFSLEECARVMIPAALEHRSRARSLQRAVFCLFGREEHAVFARVLQGLGEE